MRPACLVLRYQYLAKTATFQKFPLITDMIGILEYVLSGGAALQGIQAQAGKPVPPYFLA
jgi:hypothetical protein